MRAVYSKLDALLHSPDGTATEYAVSMDEVPESFYSMRKNLFSVLFLSIYHLLDIPKERRLLYGKLNQLFRVWVTSADNLLDDEDKVVVPIKIPGNAHTMSNVVSIMAADRVLSQVLREAESTHVINTEEANLLLEESLQILLPSAAQEASEENGIEVRPEPDVVLSTIHRHKTGILFHIPLLGPESIEDAICPEKLAAVRDGLMSFGIGCQLLDDVRDLGRDLHETRHNYALSMLYHKAPDKYVMLNTQTHIDRLYRQLPEVVIPTARLGLKMMREGIGRLNTVGLGVQGKAVDTIATGMFKVLDLGDVSYV